MPWECLQCGRKNLDDCDECEKCQLDKDTAINMIILKRKRMCEDCGHMHREGLFCHVYTEAAEDDMLADFLSESESEKASDSDSDDDDRLGLKTGGPVIKIREQKKAQPLETPNFVKAIHYVRCNCNVGVPNDSKRFEPMPRMVMVDKIPIETYTEITDVLEQRRFKEAYRARYADTTQSVRLKQRSVDISYCIPHILSYLPLGMCSPAPMVNTYWNYGTNLYAEYIDMRNCVPWQAYRPHMSQVDSVTIFGNKLYTGGDKRVLCSDFSTGEVLSTITRDSGDISFLFVNGAELFCCSTNGSIRTYVLTHTGKNLKMNVTMWDHTRTITQLVPGLPSRGVCLMHGISNHVCDMYTSSEDRTVKLWNITKFVSLRSITSKALKTASIMRISQSERHLFCGTSNASIAVFSKTTLCERDDIHACNIPNADRAYCLQLTLKLPATRMESGALCSVTGLLCTGLNYALDHLWASDSSGQLTIWYVPEEGLDFVPAYTIRAHHKAITGLINTYRHVISISDDGCIKFFDHTTFALVRSVDVLEWCVYKGLMLDARPDIARRLKCVALQENFTTGGTMAVGTSYGDVVIFALGTTV